MPVALDGHTQHILRNRYLHSPKTRLFQVVETLSSRPLGIDCILGALQRQYFLFQLFIVPRQPGILPDHPEYFAHLYRSSRAPSLLALLPSSYLYCPCANRAGCRPYCLWRFPFHRLRPHHLGNRRALGCLEGMSRISALPPYLRSPSRISLTMNLTNPWIRSLSPTA